MIYVAHPYSGIKEVMEVRFQLAKAYCAQLKRDGVVGVYSPIVHFHQLAYEYKLKKGFKYWKQENLHMLDLAAELHLLKLEGHDTSPGVIVELNHAHLMGTTVVDVPEEYFFSSPVNKIAKRWIRKHRKLLPSSALEVTRDQIEDTKTCPVCWSHNVRHEPLGCLSNTSDPSCWDYPVCNQCGYTAGSDSRGSNGGMWIPPGQKHINGKYFINLKR